MWKDQAHLSGSQLSKSDPWVPKNQVGLGGSIIIHIIHLMAMLKLLGDLNVP